MISKREYGSAGERRARDYLLGQGFALVAANYHTRYGEIDLVMRDGGELVFVEVKTRRGGAAGHPAEAVNAAKLRHTVRAAGFFRREHATRTPWRIDVVAITGDDVEHFRNVTA
ncbi:MAG: YraN family protein [bacterium]|nr:YraN family protein [bacterium]MDZ4247771.1 YraN family protein [Patescibacteria group bacterium]